MKRKHICPVCKEEFATQILLIDHLLESKGCLPVVPTVLMASRHWAKLCWCGARLESVYRKGERIYRAGGDEGALRKHFHDHGGIDQLGAVFKVPLHITGDSCLDNLGLHYADYLMGVVQR